MIGGARSFAGSQVTIASSGIERESARRHNYDGNFIGRNIVTGTRLRIIQNVNCAGRRQRDDWPGAIVWQSYNGVRPPHLGRSLSDDPRRRRRDNVVGYPGSV